MILRKIRTGVALGVTLVWCVVAQSAPIHLATGTIETNETPTMTLDRARAAATATDDGHIRLVRLSVPIRSEDVAALRAAGARPVVYVSEGVYLIAPPPARLPEIAALPCVRWLGELPPALKRHTALKRARLQNDTATTWTVTVLSAAPLPETFLRTCADAVAHDRRRRLGWVTTRLTASVKTLDDLARCPTVFYLEPTPVFELHGERGAQTAAGNYAPGADAPDGPGYAAWLAAHGLVGAPGVVVQIQDDGVDRGDASGLPGTAHPDLLGRIAGLRNATPDPLADSGGGHGQINAAIIAGNATVGTTDTAGYRLGQGMAPQARVYGTKVFTNFGQWNLTTWTLTDLARDAQDAGATFSSNSWGAIRNGEYNAQCAEMDALVRDADDVEPGNQPMAYFVSAGNNGWIDTINTPATAKNVVCVGATENSDADGTDGCGWPPSASDSLRQLASFSSRGPTDDGRWGVTVVATGVHVQGAASTSPNYTGGLICDQYWPTDQTDYARSTGTSHSCPIACGAGMLIHEFFATILSTLGHTATPSPAMIKAALVVTAHDMAGGYDGRSGPLDPVPDVQQGWGAVNLNNLFAVAPEALFTHDQVHVFDDSGQVWETVLTVPDTTRPTKLALAWTDPPAAPLSSPTLVNNLDLEVLAPGGDVWLGNVFDNGRSTLGGEADRLNNVECVFLTDPPGAYRVRIRAHNLAGDGLPGHGDATDQDFALFVWNAVPQSAAGVVALSRPFVNCATSFTLVVSDADLVGVGVASVVVTTSGGDHESVTLAEEGGATGLFSGVLFTESAAVVPDDGTLQVADTEMLTAAYHDADNGAGAPTTATAQATVDCRPAEMTGLSIALRHAESVALTLVCDEVCSVSVHYGLACDALTERAVSGVAATTHTIVLDDLAPETWYLFKVETIDAADNHAIYGHVTQDCYNFRTPVRPDYFTEIAYGDGNFSWQSWTWTPDGSGSFYALCREEGLTTFPTDTSGAIALALDDDDTTRVALTAGQVALYGTTYDAFYVCSNGSVTFGSGDTRRWGALETHFQKPRISGFFHDLDPSLGGTVSWQELADRAVVNFIDVPKHGDAPYRQTFQFEMFFDGRIRLTHLLSFYTHCVVGLSAGHGLPEDFAESDLSTYGPCIRLNAVEPTWTDYAP